MKHWILAPIVAISLGAMGQAPAPSEAVPSEEDCLGLIAILPTFRSDKMSAYYEE
jgi:hypothetical protein